MRLATVSIFKLLLSGALVLGLSGCAENSVRGDSYIRDPEARVFYEDFEKVWRAIHLAVRKYPILIDSLDSGLVETNFVKGDKIFSEPEDERPIQGLRYKIVIRAVKGKVENRMGVKVTILKTAEVQPDFFSGYQRVPSDGLEERALLYRVGRFIEIDNLLNRQR